MPQCGFCKVFSFIGRLFSPDAISYKIKNPRYSSLHLRRIHKIATRGTTQIGTKPSSSVYRHIRRQVTVAVSVSLYFRPSGFKAALKSPFNKSVHTAIPPPAALCDFPKMPTLLSQRFVLSTHILTVYRGFVNTFFLPGHGYLLLPTN